MDGVPIPPSPSLGPLPEGWPPTIDAAALAQSPRRSKRRSSAMVKRGNGENLPPGSASRAPGSASRAPGSASRAKEKRPSVTRFGFKKRPGATAVAAIAAVAAADTPSKAAAPRSSFDLCALIEETLGDTEGAQAALRAKVTGDKWDFKAQIATLNDIKQQLKAALAEQLKRGKRLAEAVGPLQEELNCRLRTLTHEAEAQAEAAKRSAAEVESLTKRSDERGRRIVDCV